VTSWDDASAVADAVLYEGYLLYPYRASSDKNKMRWQFGVLVPPDARAATGEESTTRTECLCEPAPDATLRLRLRFLHIRARTVAERRGDDYVAVEHLTVGDEDYTTWDEAVERHVDASFSIAALLAGEVVTPFGIEESTETEAIGDVGQITRACAALHGELRVSATALSGPFGGVCLRVEVQNQTESGALDRDGALRYAFLGAHTLLALSGGRFLSLIDPPEWARAATAECVNVRTWPVLMGSAMVLSSPIILYDNPSIAPESPQPLFDGLEIDEILTLRTMTLTDEEKRAARSTDPRARAIVDRADAMPPEMLDRLHGTVRYLRDVTGRTDIMQPEAPWWDPAADASVDPDTDSVIIDGVPVAKGARVRLAPRLSGTDAQDMFLVGLLATVQAVLHDVDGSTHVAVTIDDDPAAEMQTIQGRYRYFTPDELRYEGAIA
jgi:hypothetical protein